MKSDAFGTPPVITSTQTTTNDVSPELPTARLSRYIAKLVDTLGEDIRWTQINRNTEQSQAMSMADGAFCCIQRKTIAGPTGPVVTLRVLVDGVEPYDPKTLEGIVQLLSVTEARKTRR